MNFKTTLFLLVAMAGLVTIYVVLRPQPTSTAYESGLGDAVETDDVARPVFDGELADVAKVSCRAGDGEPWVFERNKDEDAPSKWQVTSPFVARAIGYEVEKFERQLLGLEYEISHVPGEPGAISPAAAGHDPPLAVVTLTDDGDKSVTFEIGKAASDSTTFVRLAGGDTIFVARPSLKYLMKDKAIEYRERLVINFDTKDATRLEVVDRSGAGEPETFLFVRSDDTWMMEAPARAQATNKVDGMVRTMSRMRAIKWLDDRPKRVAAYGLARPVITVRVTVEVPAPSDEASAPDEEQNDDAGADSEADAPVGPEPDPEVTVTTYELHLSDQSPIGEDTKVYMRVGDEAVVGTVLKSVADKFRPVLSDWRVMRVTTADVAAATRIELTTESGSAILVRQGSGWRFEGSDLAASGELIEALLEAVENLTAVAFVDAPSSDPAEYGLDDPAVSIRLRIPGAEDDEQIAVGAFTDPDLRRMVYVRRDGASSIAKVKARDVELLRRAPIEYRDRAVWDAAPLRIEQLTIEMENRFGEGRVAFSFGRDPDEDQWRMTAPVDAELRPDRFEAFIDVLADLTADRVVAEEGDLAAYGLDAPTATLRVSHLPPVRIRLVPEENPEEGEPAQMIPVEEQLPAETAKLVVGERDGHIYLKRADRPTIYELPERFGERLYDEFRPRAVMMLDDEKVRRFSIRNGAVDHVFVLQDGVWHLQAEPDLPLDQKEVKNLLLQIRDLRTDRYVAYGVSDPARYGLDQPLRQITISMDDDTERVLSVSAQAYADDNAEGFFATVKGSSAVFLLTDDSIERLAVSLDDLEQ